MGKMTHVILPMTKLQAGSANTDDTGNSLTKYYNQASSLSLSVTSPDKIMLLLSIVIWDCVQESFQALFIISRNINPQQKDHEPLANT